MTCTEIVREIQRLPVEQQFELHQTLARLLKEQEVRQGAQRSEQSNLAQAARALLTDYQTDSELTIFTAIDSDDFHATR